MMAKVSEFLAERAEPVVAAALASMDRAHLSGYEKVGPGVAGERLHTLYALVVRCVAERRLQPILAHAERIARERHAAGIDLGEVQTAINVLEEAIWRAVLAELPTEDRGEALGIVGTVLGAAKDRLACTYVSLAAKEPVRTLNLGELFLGTREGEPPES